MKKDVTAVLAALSLHGALVTPVVSPAQDNAVRNHKPPHHRNKLIDMGTFGGQSYLNDAANLTSVKVINNHGELAGWADTSSLNPHSPNFCFDRIVLPPMLFVGNTRSSSISVFCPEVPVETSHRSSAGFSMQAAIAT